MATYQTKDQLIESAIATLEAIEQRAHRITTGNVTHEVAGIRSTAKSEAEWLRRHKNDEKPVFRANNGCDCGQPGCSICN